MQYKASSTDGGLGFCPLDASPVHSNCLSWYFDAKSGLLHIKADVIAEDDDEDWAPEGIMAAEEVEKYGLLGIFRTLEEKCCSASTEILADVLAVVALAGQSLEVEHQATKSEQAPAEVERNL